jgi:hypothetical protein
MGVDMPSLPSRDRSLVLSATAAFFFVILALARPGFTAPADGTWSPIPPPQMEPRLFACDSLRDQLLFQTRLGTIWKLALDGSSAWSVLDPSAPVGEPFHDPIRDRVIVIGRTAGTTLVASRALAGGAWDSLRIDGLPSRVPELMVYDPARNRVVVFGTTPVGSELPTSETWILPLSGTPQWTRIFPSGTPPSGRRGEAAIFDPVRVRLLMFGGKDSTGALPQDTWELTLGDTVAWRQLQAVGVLPYGRINSCALYDPSRDQMMMASGIDRNGSAWDGILWGLPLSTPTVGWVYLIGGGRTPLLAFDRRRNRTIFADASGNNGGSQARTTITAVTYYPQLDPPRYLDAPVNQLAQPPIWLRENAAGAYDGAADRLLVSWGSGYADTWSLSLASPQWTKIYPAVPIPGGVTSSQLYGNMVLDPIRNRLLQFETLLGYQCQVYPLYLGNPAPVVDVGGVIPFGRRYPSIVYDSIRDRVLMFGGSDTNRVAGYYKNEIQALSLSGTPTWSVITPSGTPPAGRDHAAAVYDSIGDRLVIYGGTNPDSPGVGTETWVCNFAGSPTWQKLDPAGEPPPPAFGGVSGVSAAVAMYDPLRQRMLVVSPEATGVREEAWALSLGASPAWTHLSLDGPPASARIGLTAAFDTRRDAVVMFGGRSVGAAHPDLNDAWFLDFPPVVVPDVTCPGNLVWDAGTHCAFQVTVSPSLSQSADYQLRSERNWPGFPVSGSLDLQAGTPIQVPLSVPVPDTAAAGLNAMEFRITPRGAAANGSCSFHIHDATTETSAVRLSGLADPGEVRLAWYAPDATGSCTLERSTPGHGWQVIASVSADSSGQFVYVDTQVTPGERYGYRVRSVEGGLTRVSPETWIEVPKTLRLAGLQPNPAGKRLSVAFTIPDAAPTRLEMLDVSGRRVLDRTVSGLGPGVHVIELDEPATLRSGIYFVRMTHGREVLTTRGVVVR